MKTMKHQWWIFVFVVAMLATWQPSYGAVKKSTDGRGTIIITGSPNQNQTTTNTPTTAASATSTATSAATPAVSGGNYQVFAFNDLGMHCYDADYSVFAVLPPYNVLRAQVIQKGTSPKLLGNTGATLDFAGIADPTGSINLTSTKKTNFWSYVQRLFGVSLAVDTGLQGVKMPGTANTLQPLGLFDPQKNWFSAEGIPITAWDDKMKRNTQSLMRVSALAPGSVTVLSTLDTVVPASDEMNCSNCHITGGVAANPATAKKYGISTTWSANANQGIQAKENILILHDGAIHTNLKAQRPVLCASCHYSAALDLNHQGPMGAQLGKPYLSRAMHNRHGETAAGTLPDATHPPIVTGSTTSACYNCHPGTTTQCLRGAMATAGLSCEDCHGGMLAVGGRYPLKSGQTRQPWIDLPKCQSCHSGDAVNHLGSTLIQTKAYDPTDPAATPTVATNQRFAEPPNTLYRFSLGHNGVACESCHGSTHAEWPARDGANDNLAAQQIQGHTGPIIECAACHGTGLSRTMNGPHGLHNINDPAWYTGHEDLAERNRSNCQACHGMKGEGTVLSKAAADRTLKVEHRTVTVAKGKPISCNMCHSNPL